MAVASEKAAGPELELSEVNGWADVNLCSQ